ncbi:NAD(P)/FAD-dependent oxidoreductase [Roseibium aggregatum]|uniref:Hydrogen cyanide synthase subunit HcnC n=1 Tax=Roseibium aggregatum TaxID=187304 RepID=A0A0M6YEL0_9HYPH|nr:FAD-binding oxidoreductase [Roseibium aggregatum]CTQ47451.1 Hydrogen cyanide synthase subunit HcnC precursor [Roseibium aggregatum]
MAETFDIAIIGGGIAGASLASAIGGRRSVVLLERETAFGYHATGRSAAEFSLRFHSEDVGQLTRASAVFLQKPPENFTDVPLLRPRGNLLIANKDKADRLMQVFETEQAGGSAELAKLELLGVEDAVARVPFLDPDWVAGAIYDPDCWDIEVENLLQGYFRSARRAGAVTKTGCGVTRAQFDSRYWNLETSCGEIRAGTVVNAAGAWADPVAVLFGASPLGLTPHRRTAISVRVSGYELSLLPEVNEIDEQFYFKPDAGQLMVSPADETPVEPHDAWPEEIDIAYAAHYLNECTTLDISHIAHSWAGLRTLSRDRLPVIGASVEVPGLFWLAGLGGFGIQTSPAIGQLAATLITGEELPLVCEREGVAVRAFSPQRFTDTS